MLLMSIALQILNITMLVIETIVLNDKLHSEAISNINGIGIDIVLPDSFSIFLIYERNQAIDSGHADKIHIAIGYLPNKETNFEDSSLQRSKFRLQINAFQFGKFNFK